VSEARTKGAWRPTAVNSRALAATDGGDSGPCPGSAGDACNRATSERRRSSTSPTAETRRSRTASGD